MKLRSNVCLICLFGQIRPLLGSPSPVSTTTAPTAIEIELAETYQQENNLVREILWLLNQIYNRTMPAYKKAIQNAVDASYVSLDNKYEGLIQEMVNAKREGAKMIPTVNKTYTEQMMYQAKNQSRAIARATDLHDDFLRDINEDLQAIEEFNRTTTFGALEDLSAEIDERTQTMDAQIEEYSDAVNASLGRIALGQAAHRAKIAHLATNAMSLQFAIEEKVRSDGDSGVKAVRQLSKGPDNYYEASFIAQSVNMVHDHSNYDQTCGMGEIWVTMNGVDFRTRHNDFKLKMKATNSTEYQATEFIPFPGVPPSVQAQPTVEDQILEMRQYFKAFADQNRTLRDYTEYIKPILCYLEGAWTLDKDLVEPFDSDRHQIDASSWFDLQEKLRFVSYTGTKSRLENFASLPTTIMSINENTGLPVYAQWNYRIVCHPLKRDVPTEYLKQVDDLSYRIPRGKSIADVGVGRAARYRLDDTDQGSFRSTSLLDQLFAEVPGMDNIPPDVTEDGLRDASTGEPLNTGYYHHFYNYEDTRQSKRNINRTLDGAYGFSDASLYVARTTQNRVAPLEVTLCKPGKRDGDPRECEKVSTRVSYAIPLELIYLTPLLRWNPYHLNDNQTHEAIRADGRNGGAEPHLAFNGTNPQLYFYHTPVDFYQDQKDASKDPADTTRRYVGVLDREGYVRKVTASGMKIKLYDIQGVGAIRLRYPIAPVHGEGSPMWKELNALKHLVKSEIGVAFRTVTFATSQTFKHPPGEHYHELTVSLNEYKKLLSIEGCSHGDASMDVWTTPHHGHKHELRICFNEKKDRWEYRQCDGNSTCWDGHPRPLRLVTDVEALEEELEKKRKEGAGLCGEGMELVDGRCRCLHDDMEIGDDGTCHCMDGMMMMGDTCQCPDGMVMEDNTCVPMPVAPMPVMPMPEMPMPVAPDTMGQIAPQQHDKVGTKQHGNHGDLRTGVEEEYVGQAGKSHERFLKVEDHESSRLPPRGIYDAGKGNEDFHGDNGEILGLHEYDEE